MRCPSVVLLCGLAACVIDPVDTSAVSDRRQPLTFNGYAQRPSAPLQVLAWNYQRTAWEPVHSLTSTTSSIGERVVMYGWRSTPALIGNRYWVPPGAPCATGGMGRFLVRERTSSGWFQLKTFTPAGRACLDDELNADAEPFDAGNHCYTGDTILLFAPGTCATAPATDLTPPTDVVLRATDDDNVWQRTGSVTPLTPTSVPRGRPLRLRADAVDRDGIAGVQIDYEREVTCGNASGTVVRFFPSRVYSPPQTVSGGASVATTAGIEVDVAPMGFPSDCPAGTTVRGVRVRASATAYSRPVTGTTVGELWFALTP